MICTSCNFDYPASHFAYITRNGQTKQIKHCNLCRQQYNTAWRSRNYENRRNYELKRQYNITLIQFNEMVARQNGKCALNCGKAATTVDHDHKTGQIRGILCMDCNRGLGLLGDTLEAAKQLIEYLDTSDKIQLDVA
jgi:hypothetical protein